MFHSIAVESKRRTKRGLQYEKGGTRNFVLMLSAGDVNVARRLN